MIEYNEAMMLSNSIRHYILCQPKAERKCLICEPGTFIRAFFSYDITNRERLMQIKANISKNVETNR